MIQCQNYTLNTIYVEADGFRGATCTIYLKKLLTDNVIQTGLYDAGSYTRFGVYELNLSPTQSGIFASALGFTGPGIDVSYGQYQYDIKKDTQLLERGILWVFGENISPY